MEKVKSISEAFSMQPHKVSVIEDSDYEMYYDKINACKEIKFEYIRLDGDTVDVYNGYNFEGKKIFQYIAKSVNVEYDVS